MAQRTLSRYTEFGGTLLTLMYSKGLRNAADLSAVLEERGIELSRQSINEYLIGSHSPKWTFVAGVADALELNEEEGIRLAVAYAYGQDK